MKKLLTHLAILSLLAAVAMPMIACTPEEETEIETEAGELEIEGEGAYADDVEAIEDTYDDESLGDEVIEDDPLVDDELDETEPPPAG